MTKYEVHRDGKSVGHVLVSPDHQKPGGSVVEELYVAPGHRRQGLGRQLLSQAQQAHQTPLRIRPRPFKDMPMGIDELKGFYESAGFRGTGDKRDNMVFDKLAFAACIKHLTKLAAMDEGELARLKKMQEELELKAHKGLASDADKALYKSNFDKINELTPQFLEGDPGWKNWQPPKRAVQPTVEPLGSRLMGFAKRHPVAAVAGAGALYGGATSHLKNSLMTRKQRRELEDDVDEVGGPLSRFALKHPGVSGALMGGATGAAFMGAVRSNRVNALGAAGAALAPMVGSMIADRGLRELENKRAKKAQFPSEEATPAVPAPKSGPAVQHPSARS